MKELSLRTKLVSGGIAMVLIPLVIVSFYAVIKASSALRAAQAARDTGLLIENTVTKTQIGSGLVRKTEGAFAQVSDSTSRMCELIAEIATASSEQALGIEQINRAMVEMDRVVQQNAANAEQSASASEQMSAQGNYMTDYVRELMTLVTGGTDAGNHAEGNNGNRRNDSTGRDAA